MFVNGSGHAARSLSGVKHQYDFVKTNKIGDCLLPAGFLAWHGSVSRSSSREVRIGVPFSVSILVGEPSPKEG